MDVKTTEVFSEVRLIGFHNWPGAHDERAYLRDRHRHVFHVTPVVRVSHGDRDVEFHDLRDVVTEWWNLTGPERGAQSCEHMAADLVTHLTDMGLAVTSVTVSEDGYDGAVVRLT